MDGRWLAGGALLVSFFLALGQAWLKHRQAQPPLWREMERRGAGSLAAFFYFVGLPYLTVIFGALPARLLGLTGLEHFALIRLPAGLSVTTFGELQNAASLLLFEWLLDVGSSIWPGLIGLLTLAGIAYGLARSGITQTTPSSSLLNIFYAGLHWAFYRALFWLWTDDLYLGVVLGAAVVIVELVLGAYLQQSWPTQQPQILMTIIILILTSAIFYYSPNLWWLWVIHWLMVLTVKSINLTLATTETPVES